MKITMLEIKRREAGLTKAQLAALAGVQPNIIGWIESGRWKPYDTQLQKIAASLRIENPTNLLKEIEV